jgi:hypothetical protein
MGVVAELSKYMEIKDIVAKALKGEEYVEDTKDFDATQLKELDLEIGKAAKLESDTELAKVTALRKERQRLETPPQKQEDKAQNQFRDEQVELAKEKFFTDPKFKLTDEEKAQFESEFKKLDTGKMTPELIVKDMRKAFAVIKSDSLIDSQEKVNEFEKNAAEFNAGQAGGSGGPGSPDESKYSQAAKDLHKSWVKAGLKNKTLDEAQKLADRGGEWRERNLSS